MTKNNRIVPGAIIGRGSKGQTHAHNGEDGLSISLSKGHISVQVQGYVQMISALAGELKINYLKDSVEYITLTDIQHCCNNIGAMIFTPKHATYTINTANVINRLFTRIAELEKDLEPTEFYLPGGDLVSAKWCVFEAWIRITESAFVKWTDVSAIVDIKRPMYEQQIELLNVLSKWTSVEFRHYCKRLGFANTTWQSNHDNVLSNTSNNS